MENITRSPTSDYISSNRLKDVDTMGNVDYMSSKQSSTLCAIVALWTDKPITTTIGIIFPDPGNFEAFPSLFSFSSSLTSRFPD